MPASAARVRAWEADKAASVRVRGFGAWSPAGCSGKIERWHVAPGARGSLHSEGRARSGELVRAVVDRRPAGEALAGREAAGWHIGGADASASRARAPAADRPRLRVRCNAKRYGGEAGERLLDHLGALGRKRSTLGEYESFLRVHLAPFFGESRLERIGARRVEGSSPRSAARARRRRASSTTSGCSTRSSPSRRGGAWRASNPVKLVDKPRPGGVGSRHPLPGRRPSSTR